MQKLTILLSILFVFLRSIIAQPLVVTGRVKCLNNTGENSSRGTLNVIVIPGFIPPKSTITSANPPGYFEINTGLDWKDLRDKQIRLFLISKCKDCEGRTKTIFITDDQIHYLRNNPLAYLAIKDWTIRRTCNYIELDEIGVDSMLNKATALQSTKIDRPLLSSVTVVPVSALNGITKLATIAASPITGLHLADSIKGKG
ncbi:MAG: hypothetical protein M3342_17810, partial [Bacteroidota bacterium]|nr:hypothetical protein [Bacteroidota bacterium]